MLLIRVSRKQPSSICNAAIPLKDPELSKVGLGEDDSGEK